MSDFLAAMVLALVASVFGAAAGAFVLLFGSRGERARFTAELAPLRTELDDLEDRLDSWRKRENKRMRDDKNAPGSPRSDDQPQLDGLIPTSRAARLAELRARIGGRWASSRS